MHYLTAVLLQLAPRRVAESLRKAKGELRVIASGPEFTQFLGLAFDEIRQAGRGNARLLAELACALEQILVVTRVAGRRKLIREHVTCEAHFSVVGAEGCRMRA